MKIKISLLFLSVCSISLIAMEEEASRPTKRAKINHAQVGIVDELTQEVEKQIQKFNTTNDLSVFEGKYKESTTVECAIKEGRVDLLKELLKCGINPTVVRNSILLLSALRANNKNQKVVELLLKYNANPNAGEKTQGTPLLYAISSVMSKDFSFSLSVMDILLRNKANPNIRSGIFKETPLIAAIKKIRWYSTPVDRLEDYKEMIKLLLYHGADPYIKDGTGKSAIDYAKFYELSDIAHLLEHAQERLVNKLHALLSRGETFFPSEIAMKIAQYRYNYSKKD